MNLQENPRVINLVGYESFSPLHIGADTTICRAVRSYDELNVLVKFPNSDLPSPRILSGLKNEFAATQELSGQGIVQTLSLQRTENSLALIHEDRDFILLNNIIEKNKLSLLEKTQLAVKMTKSLGKVHAKGYLHRNIRPCSIALPGDLSEALLTNLQFSTKITEVAAGSNAAFISEENLAYISPEQTGRVSSELDRRSDYYSLGVTLYELFTNRQPFTADDALELIHCHLAKEPVAPHIVDQKIPLPLSEVILKLLAKSPGERYQSAHGLIQDLKACLRIIENEDSADSFALGHHDISDSFTLSRRLFGRKEEKETILKAYKKSSLGSTEAVIVRGEQGCGKTSLIRSISKQILLDRGEFISGKFDQFQRNRPYSAIIQAFQEMLRKRLNSPPMVIEAWKKRITDMLGDNCALITEVIPELERLTGPQRAPVELPLAESRNRFNQTFKNFIKVFPSPERPLVLFLDDLQWADRSSLQLIKRLMDDKETSYLLFIGSYRTDQPVEEDIADILTDIEELSPNVEAITVERLKMRHVHGFISRTLRTDRKRTEGLAKIVFTQTGGNPLFLREYMRNLYRSGLIVFNHEHSRWEWDLKAIKDISVDGNIVELMAEKIMSQPLEGQEILKTASCIGGKFDLRILMAVLDSPEEVVMDYLNMALQEGLIVSDKEAPTTRISLDQDTKSPQYLSFMHDRVQQAAYSMLTQTEKNAYHLRIGRAMLENYNRQEVHDIIFEVAAQYSLCLDKITDQREQQEIADIFLLSGRKAKRSSAFEMAGNYISKAVKMYGDSSWDYDYQNSFEMYLEWYECEYLSGSVKQSETIFKQILEHARNKKDLVKANTTRLQLYFDQSRYHEAVQIGREMLSLHGINIPLNPSRTFLSLELLKTRLTLGKKTAEELLNMAEMENPDHLEIMRLFMYTIAPAYMFNKKMVFLMVMKMIRLSIKHGNSPFSAYGYMFYAMHLAAKDFSFDKSKDFKELAVKLNRKFNNPELETKIGMLRGALHDHWHYPISQNISTLETAFRSGLLHGDNSYARYCTYFIIYYRFLQGNSISEVYEYADKLSSFVQKNNSSLSDSIMRMAVQMCKSLQGKTYTPGYLDDDIFQENHLVNMARSSGSEVVEHWTSVSKIITLSFFGYHSKALEYIEDIYNGVERTLFGMYTVPVFHLFSIVNMTAVYKDISRARQKQYLKQIYHSLSLLEKWQQNCPENFRHMYSLAKAELYRLTDRKGDALYLYEEAVRSSLKIGSFGFAGLACELAAEFHFSVGGKKSGLVMLTEACDHYEKWGATAKVQRLIQDHRLLQNEGRGPFTGFDRFALNDNHKTGHSLDISAVIKASQAISGEIVLDRLLDKLMRIVIENAGAQKACLLLHNKNKLELTAHAFVSPHGITTKIKQDHDQELYCKSIVNYVLRSKDNIVLRDAGSQGPFTIDSYIIRYKPKSILAMPVVNQQIMRGVLYLENNLSPGVFTEDRLEVLNLLCSQAAISIQNARLYSDLRDSETQHRTLLERINVGAFRCEADRDGRLLKGNRALAEMFGYHNWPEFRSTPLRSLFIEPRLYESILDELIIGYNVQDREIQMRRRDGTLIWVNTTASLNRDGSEREHCIEGVLEDVTEKRKARELERAKVAADAANKAKSDFLASMSHEIRTPMNAILGMADMLWESRLNKTQRNYVKIFKNAGENLLLLINDILDLSKIEAGQITLEEIDFNLEELFEEVGSIFALRAQIKNIEFCWHIRGDVPKIITGDPTRLRQVLVNLVGNSLKFTERGSITIEVDVTERGMLRVIIRDTGVGIPEEKMNSIFETFSQADSSTTRNFGGTGLGLSICKRMVESMGGAIFVSSQPEKGSSFAFTILPQFPIQPEIDPPMTEMSILMVDRESVCRDFLCQSLTDLGASVHLAEDLGQASAAAAEISLSDYDSRILIVGTPRGKDDRFEVLKKLKHGPCSEWKLLMLMEAKAQPRATARVKQLGASYVHRPVVPQAVVEEIRYADNHSMADEQYYSSREPAFEIEPKEQHVDNLTADSATPVKKSVLLIEDSEDNRMVIDLFLKKHPYEITYAENGKEGLEKFMAGDFDIVLMDIQMPVMDGYEATIAIREYERENNLEQTPILALTANAFQEDEQKCLECGCTAHLAKPVKKKKLIKTLEEYLSLQD